jgi:hypothetical protein
MNDPRVRVHFPAVPRGFSLFKANKPPVSAGREALSPEMERSETNDQQQQQRALNPNTCMSHSNARNEIFTNLAPYQLSQSSVITEQRMCKQQTITARRSMAAPSNTTKQAYQRPVHDRYCKRMDKISPRTFKLWNIYRLFNDTASNSRLHWTCHSN